MFPLLINVETRPGYTLFLQYDDGTEGVADLSYLSGRGVFKMWDEHDLFSKVQIDPKTNALVWNDMIDIDADNLYLKIKGLTFEMLRSQQQVVYTLDLTT
jgi:Protein of unknown function (DUF2442)